MVHFGQPGMRTQCVCQQPLPTVPPSYGPNESLRMCTDLATKLGRCEFQISKVFINSIV